MPIFPAMPRRFAIFLAALGLMADCHAAITFSSPVTFADKTKYNNTVSFTVNADPLAATTTATLDGTPIAVGSQVTVTDVRYHELRAESRDAGGALVDSKLVRFIVRDNAVRGGSEDGIPPHTPYRIVNDAPSAFAGSTLKIVAPAAWPAGLPVPMAAVLRNGAGEGLRLNGVAKLAGFPANPIQLRRGWGSVLGAARTAAGPVAVGAVLNGVQHSPTIEIEAAPVFIDVSGSLVSDTTWPANSRIRVTGSLTVSAGTTLTVGAGTIVLVNTGTATNGSAAEIVVNGTLQINGADGAPVVFAPDTAGGLWGGIEMPTATSTVNATHTIFTGSGEDETWFTTHSGYSTHKDQQALFLISGSGSGTAVGAQLHLTDCYCFSIAGQMMNSKTNTWIDLNRTLMQRAVTCGELNGSKVTIDRSALIEFPSEDATFVDADNDAIYLTNGDLSLTNNVIGFTKDDGVDSGGNGGDNPYTAAADVTPYVSSNNWFEGTYHEGNSLSGTRNVTYTGCVFLNCGQGVEDGYSASSTGNGPNALVDGCLFASNMVGVRWGDNYGSGYNYNGSMEVRNSFLLNNRFHDAWSYDWNDWTYYTTQTNSFGKAKFNVHDNWISQPDPVNHPANTPWNPATQGALLEPFMPVPGSNVGVAVTTYDRQRNTSDYPGLFTLRLSTFSSRTVGVDYTVSGRVGPHGVETTLASGTVNFAAGETLKTISAPVATPGAYHYLRVHLSNPVNAQVTEEFLYVAPTPGTTPSSVLFALGSVWKYLDNGSNQGTAWRGAAFDDSAWAQGPAQLGYGNGDEATTVAFVDVDAATTGTQKNATTYFRRTVTVPNPEAVESISLSLVYDDGAVIYLNGNRVAATAGMPVDPAHNFYLGSTSSNNATQTFTVPGSALVAGANVFAVEVHQANNTSGDISFDLQATLNFRPPLVLGFNVSAGEPLLWWQDPNAVLEYSTNLTDWTRLPGDASPLIITPGSGKEFWRLAR